MMDPLPFRLQYKLAEIAPYFSYDTANGLRAAIRRNEVKYTMSGSRYMIPLSTVFDMAGVYGDDRITALQIGMSTGSIDLAPAEVAA